MSGYLEVKYPFRSNLGLNPFKSWKRQWCILRPSPTTVGGSLAVYCSEAGAAAGTVELRSGCTVKRAKSRTRPHAFAVFSVGEPCKPRILLAAQTLQEAQQWMDKIRDLLNGEKLLGTETLLKDSYTVTIIPTAFSDKCGITNECHVTLSPNGLQLCCPPTDTVIHWQNITEVLHTRETGDKNRICTLNIHSESQGGGCVRMRGAAAGELAGAVRGALRDRARARLSRSQPELTSACLNAADIRRSSWYSGPSEISLDDTDLIMSKEAQHIPSSQLSRCSGAGDLASRARRLLRTSADDSVSSRSLASLASLVSSSSGVYEEIAEEEHTYEAIGLYGTARRPKRHPPPLPPRQPYCTLNRGQSWREAEKVTRHSSLGSLTHKQRHHKTFSVFRKRLKSDSRIATSPKSETKDKDVETKKKKFDFTPTRDIFKSFKVNRKMKNLKITSGLAKGETKSCEFLDEAQHVTSNRCSKSVECLEDTYEFLDDYHGNLSLGDADEALALPQEIVELILRGPDLKVRLKDTQCESDYVPMSPIVPILPMVPMVPPPLEHHYMVMSPRTNIA
ncbi:uncharacterized protein LOC116772173 [Danaus plexippus]|uniref:uncharacterized protein LOC116772173 n=1 Tax=Danaus plexippus TaxID=13037 RepID=UPI002AB24780|nr:uncharacterized protein LOC116772173 [Danaus plexippus]